MNNKEIIDEIKANLTNEKDVDIAYLQTEMEIYKKMHNEEVIYAIADMLFHYLDPKVKEKLDLKTHQVLDERREEYEKVLNLLENDRYDEAKAILIKLSLTFKKASYVKEKNYYDFDQMIEYFLFCENVQNAKKLKIRRYPEPITYYLYQLASIYQKENNIYKAIDSLEEALTYNPRCQYVMQELMLLYEEVSKDEEAFELAKTSLKYAYAKEQLAQAYQFIAKYFFKKQCYDIAIVCYLTSDSYRKTPQNKEVVIQLVKEYSKVPLEQISDVNDIFAKYHLQQGIAENVIFTINDFIAYAKRLNDYETVLYLLNIASELTDDAYYQIQIAENAKKLEEKTNGNKNKNFTSDEVDIFYNN